MMPFRCYHGIWMSVNTARFIYQMPYITSNGYLCYCRCVYAASEAYWCYPVSAYTKLSRIQNHTYRIILYTKLSFTVYYPVCKTLRCTILYTKLSSPVYYTILYAKLISIRTILYIKLSCIQNNPVCKTLRYTILITKLSFVQNYPVYYTILYAKLSSILSCIQNYRL